MKFVILDRDGVINFDSPHYIRAAEEWQPIPGSIEAIARLSQAGFELIVATNQSGLGRGLFGLDALEAMNTKLCTLVEARGGRIGAIFYCPHRPEDGCDCRKPASGLLDAAEREYGCSVAGSALVGDSMKDMELARAKACRPMLVLTGNGQETLRQLGPDDGDVRVFADLAAAADAILDDR